MWLIKVHFCFAKLPRWVIMDNEGLYVRAFQKSRKTAHRFQTLEEAQKIAANLPRTIYGVEIVADPDMRRKHVSNAN